MFSLALREFDQIQAIPGHREKSIQFDQKVLEIKSKTNVLINN